jgi:hypothetical protein
VLRELIKKYGSESLVFIDESGFEEFQACLYAWSKKGKKVLGDRQGKRGKRENLVAGRRKEKKDFIAPMVFTRSLNAEGFEGWLSLYLWLYRNCHVKLSTTHACKAYILKL